MRRYLILAAVAAIVLGASSTSFAQQISGDYVETRSADVYTGPCFANSEVNLVGNEAIMAWRISQGQWEGTRLEGLSVVGVVRANGTLGDPYENVLPAKAVIIVDEKATPAQRQALISFAQCMGGDLLSNAVRVEVAPIDIQVEHVGMHFGKASVQAGSLAGIQTRALGAKDHLCGNEETFYPPLTETSHSMPAVALVDQYNGPGLGVSWTLRDKRSAFVGSFSR